MENKSLNPELRPDQIREEMGCSSSTLQRSTHDINKQSPSKSNGSKRTQKTTNDLQKPQKTSRESSPKIETIRPNTSKKNKLECESSKENINTDDT